jgi:hypothetical protein
MSIKNDPRKIKAGERKYLQKNQKQGIKIPLTVWKKINDELLDKYGIKSFQALYDYLIVSGVTYLKKDIVALVRDRIPAYTDRFKLMSLAKLGKGDAPEVAEMKTATAYMFDQDYEAFNRFIIEEKNVKKFWVIQILMEEFAAENPILIDHVKECQKHKVTERKQQVSRLMNDEYILILPESEANEILERMTERYDNRQFGSQLIQVEIQRVISAAKDKQYREVEAEDDFNQKLSSIRKSRTHRANAITEPLIDDDT